MPPDIRGKSWQRANARLADLRKAAYRSRYAEFRAQGMASSKAYDRAIAVVRDRNADLFARLLAEEYQLRLAVSGAAAPAGDRGSAAAANARVRRQSRQRPNAAHPHPGRQKWIADECQRDQSGRPS